MFHYHTSGLVKLLQAGQSGISIHEVVVGKLLSLVYYRFQNAHSWVVGHAIRRRRLVGVFSIAQRRLPHVAEVEGFWEGLRLQVLVNDRIVPGRVGKGFLCQALTGGECQPSLGLHILQYSRVVLRVYDYADPA